MDEKQLNVKKMVVYSSSTCYKNLYMLKQIQKNLQDYLNGTGLVLKMCETKNNVWKRYVLSIQNSIDNHIEIT